MSKKVANIGIFIALAMILSYVEVLIPIHLGIPGVKLGLANIVTVVGMYVLPLAWVWMISLARIFLTGVLFSNAVTMMYSFAGGILSLIVMSILKKVKGFSMTGVSLAGAVSHNVGQILMAAVMLKNGNIMYYLPALLLAGVVTGILIGLVSGKITKVVKKMEGYVAEER